MLKGGERYKEAPTIHVKQQPLSPYFFIITFHTKKKETPKPVVLHRRPYSQSHILQHAAYNPNLHMQ